MPQISDLNTKRRIAAELLAYVVWKLFPNVLLLGGNSTKIGFYYDFSFEQPLPADALRLIEVHLRTLLKENHSLRFASMMRENAHSFFMHHKQPILAEKAGEEESNIIDLLQIDTFSGICPAFPLEATTEIGCLKLLDAQNEQIELFDEIYPVTRITGTVFPTLYELKQFTKKYESYLKKKDHRMLGRELNLFSHNEQISEVEWFWHPKGQCLRSLLQNWVESQRNSFNLSTQNVATPLIINQPTKKRLRADQFSISLDEGGCVLGSSRLIQHAYLLKTQCDAKEQLPLRLLEYGMSYQKVPKSELCGLLSAQSALTDQATVCCQSEQVIKELISFLLFIEQIIRIFGFEAHWYLVTSPKKSSKERAEKEAVEWLTQAMQHSGRVYPFQPERVEEEWLEGPRLEMRIVDELQREWPGANVTVVVHERRVLDLLKGQTPNILVKQSVWGSLDRFVALLIESCAGFLPFWVVPEQVRFLAIGQSVHDYSENVAEVCKKHGLRVKVDHRDVKLSEKVHDARKEKIPYVVIIGEQEVKKNQLTVQSVQRPEKSQGLKLDEFLEQILKEANCPVLKPEVKL